MSGITKTSLLRAARISSAAAWWAVGAFGEHAALQLARVVLRDHLLYSRRHQHVAALQQEIVRSKRASRE